MNLLSFLTKIQPILVQLLRPQSPPSQFFREPNSEILPTFILGALMFTLLIIVSLSIYLIQKEGKNAPRKEPQTRKVSLLPNLIFKVISTVSSNKKLLVIYTANLIIPIIYFSLRPFTVLYEITFEEKFIIATGGIATVLIFTCLYYLLRFKSTYIQTYRSKQSNTLLFLLTHIFLTPLFALLNFGLLVLIFNIPLYSTIIICLLILPSVYAFKIKIPSRSYSFPLRIILFFIFYTIPVLFIGLEGEVNLINFILVNLVILVVTIRLFPFKG